MREIEEHIRAYARQLAAAAGDAEKMSEAEKVMVIRLMSGMITYLLDSGPTVEEPRTE